MVLPTAAPTYPPAGHIRIALDAGIQPATRRPLLPGAVCGTCTHLTGHTAADGAERSRCALAVSRRGGPDVRAAYPACDLHETTP